MSQNRIINQEDSEKESLIAKNNISEKDDSHILKIAEPKVNLSANHFEGAEIYYPYYSNDARTQIKCILKSEQGTLKEINTNQNDKLYEIIRSIFHNEELEHNTRIELQRISSARNRKKIQHDEDIKNSKNEGLFQTKSELFKIEEIAKSKHIKLKTKARRAKSITEVLAYGAAIIVANAEE